jgi:hypothetical protein
MIRKMRDTSCFFANPTWRLRHASIFKDHMRSFQLELSRPRGFIFGTHFCDGNLASALLQKIGTTAGVQYGQ